MNLINENKTYQHIVRLNEKLEHPYGRLVENYKNRIQVSRNEIIDILNKTNDNQSANGKFASVTYVKAAKIYKTKKTWRSDDVQAALNQHKKDYGDTEWFKQLDKFNKDSEAKKNPLSANAIIVTQRYVFHWKTPETYKKDYGDKYAEPLRALRQKYGIGIDSDGMLGDNHNQRRTNDYGMQFNQTENPSIDFDMSNAGFEGKAYFANADGTIITDNGIPYDVIKSMSTKRDKFAPEAEAKRVLGPEELEAYTRARKEIVSTFNPMNLKFDQILCIAAWDGEESYFYINDKLTTPIVEKGEVLVNRSQMIQLAQEQLDETFNGINNFASENTHTVN